MTIPFSTNSNMVISKYAIEGLKKIFKKGINYKKAGAIVMGLDSSKNYQLNMFENENPKHKYLMKTIDFIQKKEGQSKMRHPVIMIYIIISAYLVPLWVAPTFCCDAMKI